MGRTLLLACLLLSQVRMMVCPACRSIGAAGLMAVAAAAGQQQCSTRSQHSTAQGSKASCNAVLTNGPLGSTCNNAPFKGARCSGLSCMPETIQCWM
jgi:hypothetical protein